MLDWFKKERCKNCREERAVRFCLRKNRDIGWKCCNGYRSDGKCPEACQYTPQSTETSSSLPQIKSDSRAEFLDFADHYLQFWIHAKIEALDNRSPQDLSQTTNGTDNLKNWLGSFSYPDSGVLALLNNKLNLKLDIPKDSAVNPESVVKHYLDAVIAQEWDKVIGFHILSEDVSAETLEALTKDTASHPALKKTRQWEIISAGFTEDHKQAFVFCELNGIENWTFIFVALESKWHLYQTIHGTLQDYYAQKNLFRDIATQLTKRDDSAVYGLLPAAEKRYPLCADIQYYFGLYYSLLDRPADAKTAYLKAIALEPNWHEPRFQLAMLHLSAREYETALSMFTKLAEQNPHDFNVQNNMGVCYMGLNQPEKAKAIWEEASKVSPNAELIRQNLDHLDNG
jgi:tetratricopeptide (TPR) repeat protein